MIELIVVYFILVAINMILTCIAYSKIRKIIKDKKEEIKDSKIKSFCRGFAMIGIIPVINLFNIAALCEIIFRKIIIEKYEDDEISIHVE